MLMKKADEDVRVYILLYWEKPVLDLDWKSFTFRWSHHGKLVVVDRRIAFFGGIDLCYGCWDTSAHELMDRYPIHRCAQEYCEDVEAENRYSLAGSQIPRMPWHDVACVFTGDAVSDAVKHFSQRYYALNPTLGLPKELDVSESKVLDVFISPYTKTNIQILQSVAKCLSGQPHEATIYNAYLHATRNAEKMDCKSKESDSVGIGRRLHQAYIETKDFHVMIVLPLKSEFPEDWKSNPRFNGLIRISYWNYATLFSGEHSLTYRLKGEFKIPESEGSSYLSVYGLRTHDLLGEKMETEIVYVHSKVMIVNDRVSIIGSAVIVEDVEMV
ncbi:phospholipase D1-like [Xenia sp. Carnegie-2017]|uniref:phospholipase D1-like n=1 Tax=Xenia sp. Carnegie-2017 TaxID=2897299 RepID=UPI001F04C129|nr:phospholipase D1-like [Xenia sp. Carnegie-2017]